MPYLDYKVGQLQKIMRAAWKNEKLEIWNGKVIHLETKAITIENALYRLKFVKLLPWQRKFITDIRLADRVKSATTNSVRRGSIPSSIRKAINERDDKSCIYCGACITTEIAHVVSRGAGGSGSDMKNLITLCRVHHQILDNPVGSNELKERNKIKEEIKEYLNG